MTVQRLHRSLFDALVAKDYDAIRTACAPDYLYRGPDGATGDLDTSIEICIAYTTAFPDLTIRIDGEWSPNENTSIIEYTATGTHNGEFAGMPASGRTVTTHGCSVIETRDGKVVRERQYLDQLSILQQLGAANLLAALPL